MDERSDRWRSKLHSYLHRNVEKLLSQAGFAVQERVMWSSVSREIRK